METQEIKFYLKKSISTYTNAGLPWDYPIFFIFTSEDKDRIQRNYLHATLNGLSPEWRKICMTQRCQEGYTYQEAMEEMQRTPECSEEEFNWCLEIPHWNPIERLDKTLAGYAEAIKKVEEFTIEELAEVNKCVEIEINDLPDVGYTRAGQ